jgi:hypothetical protein
MINITSFEDMLEFINGNELTEPQINAILISAIGIITIYPFPKQRLIDRLRNFWNEWGMLTDRPLFLETEDQIHSEIE